MARFLAVILVMLPALCAAQSWLPFSGFGDLFDRPAIQQRAPQMARNVAEQASLPIRFSDVAVKPLLARQSVGVGDQIDITNRCTLPQLSVAAEVPGWCELRYTGRTRQTWDQTLTPPGEVTIGTAVFNKQPTGASGGDTQSKPIELTWWTESHQLEAMGRTAWPIQPYIVAHLHRFDITGRAEGLEGTERYERWFPAIGVAFRVPFLQADITARAAAWQGFSTINLAVSYSPIPYVTVGAEYLREDVCIGNLHHRLEGPMASVGIRW